MNPMRFEDWCLNIYSVIKAEDAIRRKKEFIYTQYKRKISTMIEQRIEMEKESSPLDEENEKAIATNNQLRLDIFKKENEITHIMKNITEKNNLKSEYGSNVTRSSNLEFTAEAINVNIHNNKEVKLLEKSLETAKDELEKLQSELKLNLARQQKILPYKELLEQVINRTNEDIISEREKLISQIKDASNASFDEDDLELEIDAS